MSRLVIEGRNGPGLPDAVFNDRRISSTAKWILEYLLRRPDDWSINRTDIERRCHEGKAAVSTAIKELKGRGYLSIDQDRGENGRRGVVTWMVRVPVERHVENHHQFPASGNPESGLPESGDLDSGRKPLSMRVEPETGNPDSGPLRSTLIESSSLYQPSSREDAPLALGSAARASSSETEPEQPRPPPPMREVTPEKRERLARKQAQLEKAALGLGAQVSGRTA